MFFDWLIGKYIVVEVQTMYFPRMIGLGLLITRHIGDHKGIEVEVYLPWLWLHVQAYDLRHEKEEEVHNV